LAQKAVQNRFRVRNFSGRTIQLRNRNQIDAKWRLPGLSRLRLRIESKPAVFNKNGNGRQRDKNGKKSSIWFQ
jgi:hypothetical protein